MSDIEIHTTTRTRKRVKVGRNALLAALRQYGVQIPVNAAVLVFMSVPFGDDYSGVDLDIDTAPLIVEWEEIS